MVGRLLFLRQTRISVSRKIQFGGQIIKRKKTRSTKHFVSWWIVTGHKKQKSTFCYNNPIVIFYFVILRSMVEGAGSTDIALCVNQLTIPLTIWPSGWVLIFFNIPPSPIPSTISVHPFRQRRKIFVFFFLESKLLPRNYLFSPTTKRKKKKNLNKRRFGQVNNAPLAGLRSGSIPPSLISLLWIIFWFFV